MRVSEGYGTEGAALKHQQAAADTGRVAATASSHSVRPFVSAGIPASPLWTTLTPKRATKSRQVRRVVADGVARRLADDVDAGTSQALWRVAAHAAATFALVVTVGMVAIATLPAVLGYRPVVVTSGSMEPAIRTADVVVTAGTDGKNLKLGSVIDHEAGDEPTLHRIVEVTDAGYRTAGDANRVADSTVVAPEQVRGVGLVVVPFVGRPYVWSRTGSWLQLVLLVGVIALAAHVARPSWLRGERRW